MSTSGAKGEVQKEISMKANTKVKAGVETQPGSDIWRRFYPAPWGRKW